MSFFNQRGVWKDEEKHTQPILEDRGFLMSLSELARKNPPNGISMSASRPKGRKPIVFNNSNNNFQENNDSTIPSTTPPILSSAPRVTVIDGKLVVDEESLVIDRPSILDDRRERVEETSKWTTSASFRKNIPRGRWSDHDTQQFYKVRTLNYLP